MNESQTSDPAVINGKRYSLWPQFVAHKEEYIGGELQEQQDSDAVALGLSNPEFGGWYKTTITDIRFEANGEKGAAFFVDGKEFGCGSDVEYLFVDPDCGGNGWLCFGGYGGHKWRIRKHA